MDTTPLGAKARRLEEPEAEFERRLDELENAIVTHVHRLYGHRRDFHTQLEAIIATAAEYHLARSDSLRRRDAMRELRPRWFQEPNVVGAWLYVDRYAGTLAGLEDHLDELCAAGVTHIHLMPVYARPEDEDDGGYAVSDYRKIHPPLGTMDDLVRLANAIHERDMTIALDFVFNHTADDHPWARAAKAGNVADRDAYLTFDSQDATNRFAPHLRSIFPDEKPGAFIHDADLERWVWATFHDYQWDLDYRNPETFRRMLGEMLFLANVGVDVLRLDAVPFIWKEPGTPCENLAGSHVIIRALNALVRLAAPAMVFKSEAIVHPSDVRSYLGSATPYGREAEMAYNPVLMVGVWESLATGSTALLRRSMQSWFATPSTTAWVNYVRSHDDIGWGFADDDAAAVGIDPVGHRAYLTEFYVGDFPNSFAVGAPFQANPVTGDVRVSGTTASLAGLERAIQQSDDTAIGDAINRIILMHGVILATPGVPLLNATDLIGMRNDHSYMDDPQLREDSRWLHRPQYDWEAHATRHDQSGVVGSIYAAITHLIHVRSRIAAFGGGATMTPWDVGNDALYVAAVDGASVLVVANFVNRTQRLVLPEGAWFDVLDGTTTAGELSVPGYGIRWLVPEVTVTH